MPDVTLTIAEAVTLLEPRITERQLRTIIRALDIPPTRWRYTGKRGHPTALYDATLLMRLHQALTPWLGVLVDTGTKARTQSAWLRMPRRGHSHTRR